MTGHPAQDRINAARQPLGPDLIQLIQHIHQQRLGGHLPQNRRHLPHRHRGPAKPLHRQPKPRQLARRLNHPRRICRRKFNDFRDQQRLRRNPVFGHLPLQPLVDKPFMGRMLVNDDHASVRLRDDVILMHLRPRRAQRVALAAHLLWFKPRRGRLRKSQPPRRLPDKTPVH